MKFVVSCYELFYFKSSNILVFSAEYEYIVVHIFIFIIQLNI